MSTALSFEHVSKHYRGARAYRALREDVMGLVGRFRPANGRGSRFLKALDDVSFEVVEGESFGVIGDNGAGKTTAMRLANRITYPTAGRIRVRGRVGALIEVGTGLHPELTGRENIVLYGQILGLTRADIRRRYDEIVDFSGIADALDQPVKQYSSGMQLRLGFSLAAHLEPDVLLVDEAIAVGDAGFQLRCVERMRELVHEGRTLLFISHDMRAVESLCNRALRLDHGRVVDEGPAREVVHAYVRDTQAAHGQTASGIVVAGDRVDILNVSLHDETGRPLDDVPPGKPLTVRLDYRAHERIERPVFSVGFGDGRHGCFTVASTLVDDQSPEPIDGEGHVDCTFLELPLSPRAYEIWGSIGEGAELQSIVDWQRLRWMRVAGGAERDTTVMWQAMTDTVVQLPHRWSYR